MTHSSPHSLHGLGLSAVSVLTALSFVAAALFYGLGYNHLFLTFSCLAVAAVLVVLGPELFAAFCRQAPWASSWALVTLALLVLHQLLGTHSADTSYSPSWILASGPLWLLIAGMITTGCRARSDKPAAALPIPFWLPVGLVVCILALSTVRFALWQIRPQEPFLDPTTLSVVTYLLFIPAAHWWMTQTASASSSLGGLRTAAAIALSFMALLTLFAGASRAAAGIVVLAYAFWACLALLGRIDRRRYGLLLVTALLAWGLCTWLAPVSSQPFAGGLIDSGADQERALLNKAALELIGSYWPSGAGVYMFLPLYQHVRVPAESGSAGFFVHNDYLQIALEGGLWLLVPMLAFVLLAAAAGLCALRSDSGHFAGFWMAVGAVALHALFNFTFYTLIISVLVGAIAGVALALASAPADRASVNRSRPLRALWVVFVLILSANSFYLTLDSYSLSVLTGQPGLPGTQWLRGSSERQLAFARTARQLNGNRGLPALALASAQASTALNTGRRTDERLADALYTDAVRVDPWNPYAQLAYIQWLRNPQRQSAGDRALADQLLADAFETAPLNLDVQEAVLASKLAAGNAVEAQRFAESKIYPWLEYHRLKGRRRTEALFDTLQKVAARAGRNDALAHLQAEQARLERAMQGRTAQTVWLRSLLDR